MPELPEVQTVINYLKTKIINQKINNVIVSALKVLKNATPKEFKKFLVNEHFVDIKRIGKYIIFILSNNKVLVSHLRMEGKYKISQFKAKYDERHVLVRFILDDFELHYHDTRRFGTFHIHSVLDYQDQDYLKKLAIDPTQEEWDWKYLKNNAQKSSRVIKSVLLDQSVVAGIGNIYADEILFLSKINPAKKANELTDQQFKEISKNATKVLLKAIELNGTTIFSYQFKENHAGSYQDYLNVHLQKDKPCKVCGNLVKKTKLNNRGTYYCAKCQK
ncbi:DNA-formamidopyrimidine glycosylase [Mycoplasmoides gallisepticum]|uniref:DNA-formamidopyrimidine glycosylase n=1 Tax=Mycoplasmoides gallisepticum TaxID=2096 RepID=UPI001247206A|nr:DNA-formamidopyrimidine glycosylase [Mycoplasmoides gallisepticum]QEX45769.1 DNA-formamidopyrimidine glycosylase [Mycoplasmoides gallisepticum]QEX47179.1 DNA-formamidopyrimidine glycosylase [Mycoplasmoides gallisepticum]ULH62497.1 DNA-formamidopyrimidine glycosylase [Mycoplasmoides gallisepticum]ULH67831.1 DNA-formamidopyrimidine glycosylase [Mycoplasmoides gallisepticum]ULH68562.1 DNA-formamidopyrimidine glycosylase [Mycoplasmoides gallisepticum]